MRGIHLWAVQRVSNAENVSIYWRHHAFFVVMLWVLESFDAFTLIRQCKFTGPRAIHACPGAGEVNLKVTVYSWPVFYRNRVQHSSFISWIYGVWSKSHSQKNYRVKARKITALKQENYRVKAVLSLDMPPALKHKSNVNWFIQQSGAWTESS